jgi:aryl-alcohol dehydrogenase-like predicted oxidoreductase
MEYRVLGNTGLRVSVLAMGTGTFTGGEATALGSSDVKEASRLVDVCIDAGINLIDTADVYNAGVSESIVGEVLRGRRDKMLIATKLRAAMSADPNDEGLSRHHIARSAEASLKRLNTDHIDIYIMHGWDGLTPVEETLAGMDLLVRSGKVRYIGVSNFSGWHVMKMLCAAKTANLPVLSCNELHYSLFSREAEQELLPIAVDQGLGILVWSPLAGGLLSGKYVRDQKAPEGSRHAGNWDEPPIYDQERLWRIVDALRAIGADRNVSAAQVALAFLRSRPWVTSMVIGARREDQLVDNLASVDLELSGEELRVLEKVSDYPLAYPYWHQAKAVKTRLSPADQVLHGSC